MSLSRSCVVDKHPKSQNRDTTRRYRTRPNGQSTNQQQFTSSRATSNQPIPPSSFLGLPFHATPEQSPHITKSTPPPRPARNPALTHRPAPHGEGHATPRGGAGSPAPILRFRLPAALPRPPPRRLLRGGARPRPPPPPPAPRGPLRRPLPRRPLPPRARGLPPLARDPDVSLARLRLAHVSVAARPAVAVTISAALKVRVRNPDLFALDYSHLDVDIGYRGKRLGRVTSGGGRAPCRTSTPTCSSTGYASSRTRSTCSRTSLGGPWPSTPSSRSTVTSTCSSSASPSRCAPLEP
ncbi:uncharacterized protein C2845_PM02G01850 [Panicum miliaceum]|uniref:Late embryogenesis abundant protein LEA-2 subgroup domain-containing protein n=1 Tax=Panicum miliaceum TaxID=4540 RepID=A0A3L6S6D3_PANMI|nr:uncharacterized protein C2845_PM02G01850 [Panicum miliaceum]